MMDSIYIYYYNSLIIHRIDFNNTVSVYTYFFVANICFKRVKSEVTQGSFCVVAGCQPADIDWSSRHTSVEEISASQSGIGNMYDAQLNSGSGTKLQGRDSLQQQESYPCFKCGRAYALKASLSRHLLYECGKEAQFQCPYCPKKSKLKSNLLKHMKIHSLVGKRA